MAFTYKQLSTPVTDAEALETLRKLLAIVGFNSTSWQTGSPQLAILKLFAWLYARMTEMVAAILFGGYNETAEDDFLDHLSASHYDNERIEARATQGICVLTLEDLGPGPATVKSGDQLVTKQLGLVTLRDGSAPGSYQIRPGDVVATDHGSYTVQPGDIVTNANGAFFKLEAPSYEGPYPFNPGDIIATDGSRTFRNVEAGTLDSDHLTLPLTFEAEVAGSEGNVAPSTITMLQTTLAGVTINNPAIGDTGTWITQLGYSEESDEQLRTRNRTKWARLSFELTYDGAINIALNSSPSIRKVELDDQNPRGAGTVDIYVAGENATAGTQDVATVQAAFNARVLNNRAERVKVLAAPILGLDLIGTVWFDPAFSKATVQENVEAALAQYIKDLPLGGSDYTPGPAHKAVLGDIKAAIENSAGVKTVAFSSPTADIPMSEFELLAAGDFSRLTYTPTVR